MLHTSARPRLGFFCPGCHRGIDTRTVLVPDDVPLMVRCRRCHDWLQPLVPEVQA